MAKAKAPQSGGLTKTEQRELEALGRVARPDYPVSDVLHEALELDATLSMLGERLARGGRLEGDVKKELSRRRLLLGAAETAWLARRKRVPPIAVMKARAAATSLKRDVVAALRYFVADDAGLKRALDDMAKGTGDADLIDSLGKLAHHVTAHAAALGRADLPEQPAEKLRAHAKSLSDAVAARAADPEAVHAKDQRDRAFWHLRALMDEIRAAGRYVFRNDRNVLRLFRSTSSRARPVPSRAKGVPAEVAGGPDPNSARSVTKD